MEIEQRKVIVELVNTLHIYQIEDVWGEPDIEWLVDYSAVEQRLFAIPGVTEVMQPCPAYGGWTVTVEVDDAPNNILSRLERAVKTGRRKPKMGRQSVFLIRH